jgi:hypothetical protein
MSTKVQPGFSGFPPPVRGLPLGDHPFLEILPGSMTSPALNLVGTPRFPGHSVLETARVRVVPSTGYCWIDETVPIIVLTQTYYRNGNDLDLYLDLLHEVTHLRQLMEGRNIWDESIPYHQRPTEIEGFAVAVAEGRRLGLDENAILEHLSNPWMSAREVGELLYLVDAFLGGPLPTAPK